ncbi:MAG: DUF1638 domain-containing protein [bacterium]|nr:DUF1638 domain-containing protein [bacterium]
MLLKLLACDVLTREVCYCVARSPHAVTPAFTPKGEHNVPVRLKDLLQNQIDATEQEEAKYDAILLGYGLCGNAVVGLTARTLPLVIPRAHDCTTLFLGSREAFAEHFGDNPSQGWASVGYSEHGDSIVADASTREHLAGVQGYDDLVAQYGEENARFLAESLGLKHTSDMLYFLDVPETRVEPVVNAIKEEADREGVELKTLPGSLRLIEMLVSGSWPAKDFLVVPPGHQVVGVYDMDEVIKAVAVEDE